MIVVSWTWNLSNATEVALRQDLLALSHSAADVTGFLSAELLKDAEPAPAFHWRTRWLDEAAYQSWYSGPLRSLAFDASRVEIRRSDLLSEAPPLPSPEPAVPPLFARTRSVYWLSASLAGRICVANPAFHSLLLAPGQALEGRSLWEILTEADAALLRSILHSADPAAHCPVLLNFGTHDRAVHTLQCTVELHAGGFSLIGEPRQQQEHALAAQLMELNNRWALLAREHEKNSKALIQAKQQLEDALTSLEESHWHLRKIQETLPICMFCGKVKTGDATWEGVVEYLKANCLFLSHGCCPDCSSRLSLGSLD